MIRLEIRRILHQRYRFLFDIFFFCFLFCFSFFLAPWKLWKIVNFIFNLEGLKPEKSDRETSSAKNLSELGALKSPKLWSFKDIWYRNKDILVKIKSLNLWYLNTLRLDLSWKCRQLYIEKDEEEKGGWFVCCDRTW